MAILTSGSAGGIGSGISATTSTTSSDNTFLTFDDGLGPQLQQGQALQGQRLEQLQRQSDWANQQNTANELEEKRRRHKRYGGKEGEMYLTEIRELSELRKFVDGFRLT